MYDKPAQEKEKRDYGHQVVRINASIIRDRAIRERVSRLHLDMILHTQSMVDANVASNKPWTECLERIEKAVVKLYTKEAQNRSKHKKERIKRLEQVLGPHSNASPDERNEALAEERQLIAVENESLRVLMRANRITFDEKMTKHFFKRYSTKYVSATKMTELLIDDSDVNGQTKRWSKKGRKDFEKVLVNFWSNISRDQESDEPDRQQARDHVCRKVRRLMHKEGLGLTNQDMDMLAADVERDEVLEAIMQNPLGKAPGKNGLPIEYYLIHCDSTKDPEAGDALMQVLLDSYSECEQQGATWSASMRQSIVRLLFKKTDDKDRLFNKNYRPITLQNLNYKIFYKVLSNRLSKVIHKIVSRHQHAFVPGRVISDPIHLIRLMIERAARKNTKHAVVFADIMKAFDQVSHEFIYQMLATVGIPQRFIDWVKMSFKNTEVQLIVNGYLSESYSTGAGGKQGDPLFPLIFIIVMNGLIALIETDDTIQGIELPYKAGTVKIVAFADDSTFFVGDKDDPSKYHNHLAMFRKASFLRCNDDKTLIMGLGQWSSSPPACFHSLGWTFVKQEESVRALGIMVGDPKSARKSWDKLMNKARLFMISSNPGNLTLMGRCNLANASVLGCLIYHITHQYVSKGQTSRANSLINQFTNGNKQRTQVSFADKTKPHSMGGPPVVLLDVHHMTVCLQTKSLSIIANSAKPISAAPWIPLMLEQVLTYTKDRGIYLPEHALLCNFNVSCISEDRTRVDPYVLSALRSWTEMGYTRRLLGGSYEEIASLPIWNNPYLRHSGDMFDLHNEDSPYVGVRKRGLYHVGQLFTNLKLKRYVRNSTVMGGARFKTNQELNDEFVKPRWRVTGEEWDRIRQAVITATYEGESWANICMRGNQNFIQGRHYATTKVVEGIGTIDTVYKLEPDNTFQRFDFVSANSHKIRSTQVYLPLGARGTPPTHKLRLVRTTRPPNGDLEVVGFAFNPCPTRDATASWLLDSYFGLIPHTYSPPYWRGTHKNICKQYRARQHTVNPSLVEWERGIGQPCGVDWHKQMRGLVHAFVEPRVRVNLWKLFNDRLYCGQTAHDYLATINSPLANSYNYCPICMGHVPATYKHLFWDCPIINSFWIIVQNLYQRMGSTSPVNSYYELATFIDREHMNDIVMVMEDEVIYNTFDAIWCTYCHILSIINDTSKPNRDEEWTSLITNYLHHLITHFNKSNKNSSLMLPYHLHAVETQVAYEHKTGQLKTHHLKDLALEPAFVAKPNDLNDAQVKAYQKTWTRRDASGTIVNIDNRRKFKFYPVLLPQIPNPAPAPR